MTESDPIKQKPEGAKKQSAGASAMAMAGAGLAGGVAGAVVPEAIATPSDNAEETRPAAGSEQPHDDTPIEPTPTPEPQPETEPIEPEPIEPEPTPEIEPIEPEPTPEPVDPIIVDPGDIVIIDPNDPIIAIEPEPSVYGPMIPEDILIPPAIDDLDPNDEPIIDPLGGESLDPDGIGNDNII